MTAFAIAGIQMPVSIREDNIGRMEWYADHLRKRFPWVRMLLFSGLAAFGPDPVIAVPLHGEVEARLCAIAERNGLWLIPGSLFEARGECVFNTSPVIAPDGSIVARFDAMFPFRPHETGVSAGQDFVVFDVPDAGRFGISISYDIWFPETVRQMVAMGAEVILHPTMTGTIDRDMERAIVRASAVTNQCYIFDINGVAAGGCGRSTVVDPAGYVLHEAGTGTEIMPIMIDFDKVRFEREHGLRGFGEILKSFRDRKVDFPVYRWQASAFDFLSGLDAPEQHETSTDQLSAPGCRGPVLVVDEGRLVSDPSIIGEPTGNALRGS